MPKSITVAELAAAIDDLDLALIDVRETGEYNTAHIPGSWSLPRRQIEYRMAEMVPWPGARIVVCDDDGARAALAAVTMESMGYTNVSVLAGGSNRWVTEGHGTDWGLNVPSKDFGERWLMTENVPELEPDELHEWIERGDKFILVDSRTPEEHHRACIPGSRSMPGAELGLRMWQLAADVPKDTPIVVHCAGRTRSIIGAGTLRRMGFENVYALKNGTMGWQLAGLQVEEGSDRLEMPQPSAENVAKASETARRIAEGDGVKYIDRAGLDAIKARAASENVYLLDVRTREEYAAGHLPGFRHAPGGQTVQASDSYVGVRGGTIVFACDASNVRSSMTAGWFRRMGFPNVYVLERGAESGAAELAKGLVRQAPAGYDAALASAHLVSPDALQSMSRQPAHRFHRYERRVQRRPHPRLALAAARLARALGGRHRPRRVRNRPRHRQRHRQRRPRRGATAGHRLPRRARARRRHRRLAQGRRRGRNRPNRRHARPGRRPAGTPQLRRNAQLPTLGRGAGRKVQGADGALGLDDVDRDLHRRTVPLFSSQCVVFLSSGQPNPARSP